VYLRAKKKVIKQKRVEAGLSQHKLSRLAGLGNSAVYRMEEAEYAVHPLRAKAVAEVLGCKVDDLFYRM
jgi:DNA-binding XRE family transcriptional regulator